jgi:TPR repeat protein
LIQFQGASYFDDRLFVLSLCRGKIQINPDGTVETVIFHEAAAADDDFVWCIATYRNCERYPLVSVLHFGSKNDASKYMSLMEPTVPLTSLNGQAPKRPLSYVDYLAWKRKHNVSEYDYKKIFQGENPREMIVQTADQFIKAKERVRQTLGNATSPFPRGVSLDAVRVAADQGDANSQFRLGVMYATGEGVPQNHAEAARWYRLAADQGLSAAQYNLGLMYVNGWGVSQDYGEAARWYRLAADQGVALAQNNLGMMYYNGQGVRQNDVEAMRWFRLAADRGHPEAQAYLGFRYATGEGVPQNHAEAARWYRLAADQGLSAAQYNLGLMYRKGLGVPQDYAEAMRWYGLAADQGDTRAQYNLGVIYGKGEGVSQNDVEAMRWFRLAADQGNANAQFNVGFLYANSQRVRWDYVRAYMWLSLSAAQGNRDAVKNREIIAKHMRPEQIAEALKLAREWKPKATSSAV